MRAMIVFQKARLDNAHPYETSNAIRFSRRRTTLRTITWGLVTILVAAHGYH